MNIATMGLRMADTSLRIHWVAARTLPEMVTVLEYLRLDGDINKECCPRMLEIYSIERLEHRIATFRSTFLPCSLNFIEEVWAKLKSAAAGLLKLVPFAILFYDINLIDRGADHE